MTERSILVVAAHDVAGTGGGATRARQLAVLLARAGNAVCLIGFGGPVAAGGIDAAVEVEGVSNHTGKIARRWLSLVGQEGSDAGRRGLLAAVRRRLERPGSPVRGVLLYNQDPVLAIRLLRLCTAAGVPFLQQYAELHLAADYRARWLQGYYLREQRHFQTMPRRATGNIVISSTLHRLVTARGAKNVLQLPSFVEADNWERAIARVARGKIPGRVLYAGEGARRDGLETIIAALAVARMQGAAVSLRLVGLPAGRQRDIVRRAAAAGVADAVSVAGRLGSAELAHEYAEAAAGILIRSDDRSSRACFPTRLGEMLVAGGPVILSDMPDYNLELRDGVSAYLARPGDVTDVARCLAQASSVHARNAAVAAAGREFARTRLNVNSYTAETSRWLDAVERSGGHNPR